MPWIAPILDAFDDNPWCEGWALMKPAQSAGTEIGITFIGHLFDQDPGPTLFLCTTDTQARQFAIDRFEHMISSAAVLRGKFLRGKANRETLLVKPAIAGKLVISGSNSPNSLISEPFRYVFIDEEDRLPVFPGIGTAREIAQRRTNEYVTTSRCGIFSWAHPTKPKRGIAHVFYNLTDQREWTLCCPHCDGDIVPKWSHVVITDRDPDTAEYRCPHCGEQLTDQERWTATTAGRFVSQLDDEERERRHLVGFHYSRLCHPRVTLLELAIKFCACVSESQLRVFYTMDMGEPYEDASFVITTEGIRAKIDQRMTGRACPTDTKFITAGCDVQKGSEEIILYYTVSAWLPNGNQVLLEFGRILGWSALDALLRTFESQRGAETIRIRACGIDYGWKTRDVYSFCRQDHGGVPCIPMKHTPHVEADQAVRQKKVRDPLHPEFGLITRLELCRDHWMDRALGRLSPEADPEIGGSTILPATINEEFEGHIKSARRVEIIDRHGHSKITWEKEKGDRDDWLQCLAYGEVVAVALGLDRMHEAIPQRPKDQDREIREGVATRRERYHGRPGGYIRGRRGRRGY